MISNHGYSVVYWCALSNDSAEHLTSMRSSDGTEKQIKGLLYYHLRSNPRTWSAPCRLHFNELCYYFWSDTTKRTQFIDFIINPRLRQRSSVSVCVCRWRLCWWGGWWECGVRVRVRCAGWGWGCGVRGGGEGAVWGWGCGVGVRVRGGGEGGGRWVGSAGCIWVLPDLFHF